MIETVSPLVRRVVAANPGPFTGPGTATFIVGHGAVAVIDPGPDLAEHIDALLAALRHETVRAVLVTHTHRDHSPAARAIKAATGAPTYGFGPHGFGRFPSGEEGADHDFMPDHALRDGEVVDGPGWTMAAVHTPGHTSNHLCLALAEETTLFTGDHVMGWSTSVISPPDGDMAAYRASLARLLGRDDTLYRPTHGPAITDPQTHVKGFIAHRAEREATILARLAAGDRAIPDLVAAIYQGLATGLRPAAGRSVLAHLIQLTDEGKVGCDGAPGLEGRYWVR